MDKPIAIVIDTNCNEGKKNFDTFEDYRFGIVDDFIDFIERNDLSDRIKIILPEIMVLETMRHRSEELKLCIETAENQLLRIRGVFSGVNTDLEIKKDDRKKYIEQIEKKIRNKVEIMPIPEDRGKIFSSILDRAIYKKPPFKKDGNSDPGFKDAVLVESMLSYFDKNKLFSEIILFSRDKGAFINNSDKIKEEFNNKLNLPIEIKDDNDVIAYISERFKVSVDFMKFVNDVYYPDLLNRKILHYINIDGSIWNVTQINIEDRYTTIERLSDTDALLLVNCFADISLLDNPAHIKKADILLNVVFEKDENNNWIFGNENIISSEIVN